MALPPNVFWFSLTQEERDQINQQALRPQTNSPLARPSYLPPAMYPMQFVHHLNPNPGGNLGRHRQAASQVHSSANQQPDPGDPRAPTAAQMLANINAIKAYNNAVLQAQQAALAQQNASPGWVLIGRHGVVIQDCDLAVPEPEDAGVRVGEVIAWRSWRLREDGLLSSVHIRNFWPPGESLRAHAIGPELGDGVHAFKTREQALGYCFSHLKPIFVVGRVALWGQVYEFEQGWHGEYARIHSLDDFALLGKPGWFRHRRHQRLLHQLRATYGLEEPPS